MGKASDHMTDDRLVFAKEDEKEPSVDKPDYDNLWKILIVDDEEDVHEITRIILKGYTFEDRGIVILSAYSEQQVKAVMGKEPDIALILLDVVMENDDSGLQMVDYIRNHLGNSAVRIVLRTGQPGKAPEQDVITKYDINDYKTKPELTAQKLYTSVTSCLRAYSSLKELENSHKGLEAVIRSTMTVFKSKSVSDFSSIALSQLGEILFSKEFSRIDSAFLLRMPDNNIMLEAGTGCFRDKTGICISDVMPQKIIDQVLDLSERGGECIVDGEYIGMLRTKEGFVSGLYLKECDRLTHTQQKMLRIYANTVAVGFENISLNREIINTQKELILTLGDIVETRSQETANHVARVAEISYLLAKEIGMDEDICEMLRLATPMHDVGKIAIPEAILNKPGKLTPEEFSVIQEHTSIGYEILNKSNRSIMKTAAIVALEHHEKWDGSGYPKGLSGEKIHIYGRITAVADVFDALSHKRSYKDAWLMDQILELFKKEAGSHFDPVLVDLLLKNIDKLKEINRNFPE